MHSNQVGMSVNANDFGCMYKNICSTWKGTFFPVCVVRIFKVCFVYLPLATKTLFTVN